MGRGGAACGSPVVARLACTWSFVATSAMPLCLLLLALSGSVSDDSFLSGDRGPWWMAAAAAGFGGGNSNKPVLAARIRGDLLLSLLSPSGRGDWREKEDECDAPVVSVLRSYSDLVFLRSARRLLPVFFDALPRREGEEMFFGVSSFNKRVSCFIGGGGAAPISLANRGGEEVKGEETAAGVERWWEAVESAAMAMVHQRQHLLAVASLGQRAGPVVPERRCCSWFFVLCVRIFSGLGMASFARAAPSGAVPGGGRGGHASRLISIGGLRGLDCFLAIIFRVFCVKSEGLVVISFFCEVLFVIVHPALK